MIVDRATLSRYRRLYNLLLNARGYSGLLVDNDDDAAIYLGLKNMASRLEKREYFIMVPCIICKKKAPEEVHITDNVHIETRLCGDCSAALEAIND